MLPFYLFILGTITGKLASNLLGISCGFSVETLENVPAILKYKNC